jgi:hypothetical protein
MKSIDKMVKHKPDYDRFHKLNTQLSVKEPMKSICYVYKNYNGLFSSFETTFFLNHYYK